MILKILMCIAVDENTFLEKKSNIKWRERNDMQLNGSEIIARMFKRARG